MIFDCLTTISSVPQRCTKEKFELFVKSAHTTDLIQAYRSGKMEAKKNLPAFCFHAHFDGKPRKNENATPSGLVMIDLDHLTDEQIHSIAEAAMSEPFKNACSDVLRLIHITPSGKGLRIVFKAIKSGCWSHCVSLTDYQHKMGSLLNCCDLIDKAVKDLARLSFSPSQNDILYLDERLFTEEPDVTQFGVPSVHISSEAHPTPSTRAVFPVLKDAEQTRYDGIELREIFNEYFSLTGGIPQQGERNTRMYAAARDLRYICDFDPAVLAFHMPQIGLSDGEVFEVCKNACLSSRGTRMPNVINDCIKNLQRTYPEEGEQQSLTEKSGIKYIPPFLRKVVKSINPDFSDAVILSLLPIIGTLATKARARYIDGEIHSPSFITIVSAEQASGKSFARNLFYGFLRDLIKDDTIERQKEREWEDKCRKIKNTKELPPNPKAKIRIVPATISIARLLQRLEFANNEHLFTFCEEIDTVIKSNRGGAWSEKNDIYRNAFDNSVYGQDYLSDNSYSATVPVYYNLLLLGTPRQAHKFLKDVENGLVSRICFATLPDQFGNKLPKFTSYKFDEDISLQNAIKSLRGEEKMYDLSFCNEVILNWLEEKRMLALKQANRALDIFRRRAAVIGFRAALSLAPVYLNSKNSSSGKIVLKRFCIEIAEAVLKGQMDFAGDQLNKILETPQATPNKTQELYTILPNEFELSDLMIEMRKLGLKSPAKQIIWIWKKARLIKPAESKSKYVKIYGNKN